MRVSGRVPGLAEGRGGVWLRNVGCPRGSHSLSLYSIYFILTPKKITFLIHEPLYSCLQNHQWQYAVVSLAIISDVFDTFNGNYFLALQIIFVPHMSFRRIHITIHNIFQLKLRLLEELPLSTILRGVYLYLFHRYMFRL
jgi:hypothetical protein